MPMEPRRWRLEDGQWTTDSSEPLNIGVGNSTQGLEKSTKHLYMLSHLLSPGVLFYTSIITERFIYHKLLEILYPVDD